MHCAALTIAGSVWTWGRGKYGALGNGDWNNRSTPTQVGPGKTQAVGTLDESYGCRPLPVCAHMDASL